MIALTSFPEEDLVQRALQAGATGYLLKNVGVAELAGGHSRRQRRQADAGARGGARADPARHSAAPSPATT